MHRWVKNTLSQMFSTAEISGLRPDQVKAAREIDLALTERNLGIVDACKYGIGAGAVGTMSNGVLTFVCIFNAQGLEKAVDLNLTLALAGSVLLASSAVLTEKSLAIASKSGQNIRNCLRNNTPTAPPPSIAS